MALAVGYLDATASTAAHQAPADRNPIPEINDLFDLEAQIVRFLSVVPPRVNVPLVAVVDLSQAERTGYLTYEPKLHVRLEEERGHIVVAPTPSLKAEDKETLEQPSPER
ncbi:MAG TPA: hypothetical protein VNZ01_10230 [Solirubrobacteraceae bacterium]|jgi:hypothetical protein|nr:hypothetical protein [Solirubrobacteraceae bacterium]